MKLLIIDDDALVCASLKTILETDPQVKVVGTGGSGREVWTASPAWRRES